MGHVQKLNEGYLESQFFVRKPLDAVVSQRHYSSRAWYHAHIRDANQFSGQTGNK